MAKIESIQTGQSRTLGSPDAQDPMERIWTSAIWKAPVSGAVWAGREGLAGDAQVDRPSHGGPERALLLYPAEHYPRWRAEWSSRDVNPGGFGENLTVSGASEATVCIGDRYTLGDVKIEVSAPRTPCQTLVRRHRRPDLIERVVATDRSGWYARVLQEGWLEMGMELQLIDRPYPQWTVVRAAAIKRNKGTDPQTAERLAACPALVADWRAKLSR